MKTTQLFLIAGIAIAIIACKSSKNTTSTAAAAPAPAPASTASTTATSTEPVSPFYMTKAANGIYVPGADELTAIQVQYPDMTQDKLNKGYSLYAESACIQCHQAKNIYRIPDEYWKDICANMSEKSKISEEQKDAVYKYVLAVKASKAKSGK